MIQFTSQITSGRNNSTRRFMKMHKKEEETPDIGLIRDHVVVEGQRWMARSLPLCRPLIKKPAAIHDGLVDHISISIKKDVRPKAKSFFLLFFFFTKNKQQEKARWRSAIQIDSKVFLCTYSPYIYFFQNNSEMWRSWSVIWPRECQWRPIGGGPISGPAASPSSPVQFSKNENRAADLISFFFYSTILFGFTCLEWFISSTLWTGRIIISSMYGIIEPLGQLNSDSVWMCERAVCWHNLVTKLIQTSSGCYQMNSTKCWYLFCVDIFSHH